MGKSHQEARARLQAQKLQQLEVSAVVVTPKMKRQCQRERRALEAEGRRIAADLINNTKEIAAQRDRLDRGEMSAAESIQATAEMHEKTERGRAAFKDVKRRLDEHERKHVYA